MYVCKLPKILQPFVCEDLVRLGKNHDGGYLVNRADIEKTVWMCVFGLGTDWSFEQDFINRNNCGVDVYDNSVKADQWPKDLSDKYHSFFCQNRTHHLINIGPSSDSISASGALKSHDHVFLKCDIEGHEYQILNDLIRLSPRLSGMIIEFHDLHERNHFDLMANFLAKTDLKLAHVHVNNYTYLKTAQQNMPTVLELTLTSSSNIHWSDHVDLPHLLDQANNPQDQEFRLIF